MKKILLLLLVAALLLPSLMTACNTTPPTETPLGPTTESTVPTSTTPQQTTPPAELTTPEDVGIVVPPYALDSITENGVLKRVSITTGESENEIYAGEELAEYLTQKGVTVTAAGGFPVIIFQDVSMEEDSFSVDVTLQGDVNRKAILFHTDVLEDDDGETACRRYRNTLLS